MKNLKIIGIFIIGAFYLLVQAYLLTNCLNFIILNNFDVLPIPIKYPLGCLLFLDLVSIFLISRGINYKKRVLSFKEFLSEGASTIISLVFLMLLCWLYNLLF